MPAMRPVSSIRSAAASSISAPPMAAETCVKLAMGASSLAPSPGMRGEVTICPHQCRNANRPVMDFTLPPEIEDIRMRTRAFVEEHVLPLEANRGNYDDHENIRLDLLERVRGK